MDKNVLIVNYEPKSLSKLQKLIADAGLEVTSAKDGVEALESVEKRLPDLLIIDPMLPKLSGFEVSKKVSEQHPEIPIIIITSVYKGIKYRNEALTKYGAKDFFEIPFDDNQLLSRVKELLKIETPKEVTEKKPRHTKKSSKKRLEDILEETISGSLKDLNKPKKNPKIATKNDGVVFTSEDIFSDVIDDIEKGETEKPSKKTSQKSIVNSDSVNLEVENQLEKTLSGLKIGKKLSKKTKEKTNKDKAEPEIKKSKAVVESQVKSETEEEKTKKESKKKVTKEGIEYGSYVLLEKVATGGMAELFKAKRRGVQGFQKIVAIKRILSHLVDNEDFVTMFIDEAKLAAQLNHPNIAQIYDLGKIDKSFYIAMEYVEGYDLRNIFKECQKKKVFMPEPLVLYVASKILSALDYAHRKKGLDMKDLKIVHRDVSPQNILISKDGDVKLVDFGIAKAATKASQTQAGALKGKLLYMSPEQAWGKAIDHRSDLFSLGSVLYEGLTDKKCFLAESEISILEKVRSVQYDPINKLNPSISEYTIEIVSKALAKDLDSRYQSAKEMEQEIGKMLDALPFAVRERELAEFVEALYSGNTDKIKEIQKSMTIEKEEKSEIIAPEPKEDIKPVEEKAKKEPEVTKKQPETEEVKHETGTVIMPDMEDVEKHEEEMLDNLGPSKSKSGMYIGIAVVFIAAILGFFFMQKKNNTQKPVKPNTAVEKQKTQDAKPIAQGITEDKATEQQLTKQNNTAKQTTNSNNAAKTNANSKNAVQPKPQQENTQLNTGSGIEGIDQQKLVDELVKKKIAAREAALKEQIKKDAEKRKLELQKQIEAAKKEKEMLAKKVNEETANNQQAETQEAKKVEEPASTNTNDKVADNNIVQPETNVAETKTNATEANTEEKPAETVKKEQQPEQVAVAPAPVEPKLKTGDLVPLIEGEVEFPKILKRVEPKKTAAARRMRIRGTIVAQMLIDENGNIKDVRILRNIPGRHGLDKQVIKALKQWRFTPAIKDGVRVSVYYTQTFTF